MHLPIKLISTDFDGTLFAEFENPPVPHVLQDLIKELQRRGAKWVINTGRDLSSLMETLGRAGLSITPDYLVVVEREIHFHQESLYLPLEEWNTACSRAHAEVFARVRPDLPRLVAWINRRFHATLYEDQWSPLCLIAGNNGDMDQIHAYLEEYCGTVPGLTIMRNDVYARFSHVDFNKGTALAELARRLGCSRSEVFAVGDHLNDIPMLDRNVADLIAAPANAVPIVRQLIEQQKGYFSPHFHGEGVADAIFHYLESRGMKRVDLL